MTVDRIRQFVPAMFGTLLCLGFAMNALWYAATTAFAIPVSDAWYFLDTFVRNAVNHSLTLADFFAQRGPGDHAQPLQRLVLLGHLRFAELDFVVEALVGVLAGIASCAVLASVLLQSLEPDRRRVAWLAAVGVFAVGLSLNSTEAYTWSLVGLGWIVFLVAILYWIEIARLTAGWKSLVRAGLATFVLGCLLDELAIATCLSAIGALALRYRAPRWQVTMGLAVSAATGLAVARWLVHSLSGAQGAADATGGHIGDLTRLLSEGGPRMLLAAPLVDSVVHPIHLQGALAPYAGVIQVSVVVLLVAMHVGFWACSVFAHQRPRILVVSVAMMLFFYASVMGIAISRVPTFGLDYFHQPRYVLVYQFNLIAMILMFSGSQVAGLDERVQRRAQATLAALLVALVTLQLPLSVAAWDQARHIRAYVRETTDALAALGRHPQEVPDRCPPMLTLCVAAPDIRIRSIALLKEHHLNLYSPRFARRHGMAAIDPRCEAGVVDLAPKRLAPGERFNVQQDGRSAFWLQLTVASSAVILELDGREVETSRQGDLITWYYTADQAKAINAGQPLRFSLRCGGGTVARFEVAPQ